MILDNGDEGDAIHINLTKGIIGMGLLNIHNFRRVIFDLTGTKKFKQVKSYFTLNALLCNP